MFFPLIYTIILGRSEYVKTFFGKIMAILAEWSRESATLKDCVWNDALPNPAVCPGPALLKGPIGIAPLHILQVGVVRMLLK